jgi:hypothetical protein
MLLLALKRQDLAKKIVVEKLCKKCRDPELEPDGNRSRNQNFSKVGTGTGINHYGPTTMTEWSGYDHVSKGMKFMKSAYHSTCTLFYALMKARGKCVP